MLLNSKLYNNLIDKRYKQHKTHLCEMQAVFDKH